MRRVGRVTRPAWYTRRGWRHSSVQDAEVASGGNDFPHRPKAWSSAPPPAAVPRRHTTIANPLSCPTLGKARGQRTPRWPREGGGPSSSLLARRTHTLQGGAPPLCAAECKGCAPGVLEDRSNPDAGCHRFSDGDSGGQLPLQRAARSAWKLFRLTNNTKAKPRRSETTPQQHVAQQIAIPVRTLRRRMAQPQTRPRRTADQQRRPSGAGGQIKRAASETPWVGGREVGVKRRVGLLRPAPWDAKHHLRRRELQVEPILDRIRATNGLRTGDLHGATRRR